MKKLLTLLFALWSVTASAQTVAQGAGGVSPWRVSFGGIAQPVSISGSIGVTQVTNPWTVTFTMPPLVAGSALIGHVVTDTGSTTAVTGTVTTNLAQVGGVGVALGSVAPASSIPVTLDTTWNDFIIAPTNFSSGVGGPIDVPTPGGGTLYVEVTGTGVGVIGFQVQLTVGGTWFNTPINIGSDNSNPRLTSTQYLSAVDTSIMVNSILTIPATGIAIRISNGIGSGTSTINATYKRGSAGNLATYIVGAFTPGNRPTAALVDTLNQLSTTLFSTAGSAVPATNPAADSQSSPFSGAASALPVTSWPLLFNGSTYDRARGDQTNGAWVNIKASTTIGISAVSLPLPTLAATSTKQSDGSQKTQIVDGSGNVASETGNALDFNLKTSSITLPVSAVSLPLPTLAATSTKQSDGTQKTQIVDGSGNVGSMTANAQDINIKSGSIANTSFIATQSTGTNLHTVIDSGTVTTTPPANASTNVAQFGGTNVSLGQQLAAASMPVILPSATVTALTPPAAITGFALETGHLAAIDTATARIPPQGQALAAASLPVVLTAAQVTALTPPAIRGTTSTPIIVNATDMDTQLLAANAARVGWQACNNSGSTLLLKFGSGATPFSYNVRVASGACYADEKYTGQVNGVWFVGADRFVVVSETF